MTEFIERMIESIKMRKLIRKREKEGFDDGFEGKPLCPWRTHSKLDPKLIRAYKDKHKAGQQVLKSDELSKN